jgi:hypothetical protein
MGYLNVSFYNRVLSVLTIYFLILLLPSCNSSYHKQFYGTYENLDSNRITRSRISFYENNNYSFYSSTCFAQTRDSGSFTLTNDTLTFHSFELPLLDTNVRSVKGLSSVKFLYQPGKILYIRQLKPLNRPSFFDTILIGQKKI